MTNLGGGGDRANQKRRNIFESIIKNSIYARPQTIFNKDTSLVLFKLPMYMYLRHPSVYTRYTKNQYCVPASHQAIIK